MVCGFREVVDRRPAAAGSEAHSAVDPLPARPAPQCGHPRRQRTTGIAKLSSSGRAADRKLPQPVYPPVKLKFTVICVSTSTGSPLRK